MQPFILLPIGIQNMEKSEKEVTARIQPDQIDYYYPGFYNGTVIVNKSGNSFLTTLSVEEIDTMLTTYSKTLKANTGRFGILEISKHQN